MSRFRIPALVDLITVSDPAQIADLAEDPRLDREYVIRGPLINRIVTGRIRKVLSLDGSPCPRSRRAGRSGRRRLKARSKRA